MTEITEERVRELKEAATDGPWEDDNHGMYIFERSDEGDKMVAEIRGWGHLQYLGQDLAMKRQDANAKFIAALPDIAEAYLAKCSEVRELRDRVREWQPIETAPNDGTFFLAVSVDDPVDVRAVNQPDGCALGVWRKSAHFNGEYCGVAVMFTPTHWMPLPEAPTHE